MAAVDVDSLTITYGKVTAVDDLSFQADAGEVTCVLGPNGAGKTSTLESLEGLRRPSAGRLRVIGLDPGTDHATLTERIGVMLQEGGIHPAVRVREVLRHAAALYPNPLDPGGLIDRLGLTGLEGRSYRQLSGGEQQRLALALALIGRPQVAFLDEPTAGVDPAGRQVIRQVIADLRNDGVAVLLTTHDLDEAERVADRVVIVVGGRLVGAGTVDELTRTSGGDEQVRFRAPAGVDRDSLVRHLGGSPVVETAPGEYVVAAAPTPRIVAAITSWLAEHDLPLADLRAGRQRLEDVYLRLTAADAQPVGPEAESRPDSSPRRRRGRTDGRSSHDQTGPDQADEADHEHGDRDQADDADHDHADNDRVDRDGVDRDRVDRSDDTTAPKRPAGRPDGGAEPADRTTGFEPRAATSDGPAIGDGPTEAHELAEPGDDPAGRSGDDEGLTPATFEAFWGRRRFKSGADDLDDTGWEGWAAAPGVPEAHRAPDRTDQGGGTGNRCCTDEPGGADDGGRTGKPDGTQAPDRPDEPRRGRRRRR